MMHKLQKIVSVKILTMIALSIIAMFHSNSSFAGMPEKYGIAYTSDGKEYLKVQLYTKSCPVWSTGPDFPPIIDLIYCSDGTVTWYWGDIIDGGTKLIGTRIEETGSFAVKAGSYIGLDSWHGTGANGSSNMISIYPMMQYDGMNVLLTDCENIIFRVSSDNTILMECDKANIPSQAKVGFGPVDTEYSEWEETDPDILYSYYYIKKYKYGPGWQMFLEFSLTPIYPYQDSVDDIIKDSSEHEVPIYDIVGKRVDRQNLTPGIYICNGRKILVK